MLKSAKGRVVSLITTVLVLWLAGVTHGFTCSGSEASNTNLNGNYVLGCPMGGIGGGNFNFLPDGNYNTTYIRVAVTSGAPPTCLAFSKRGTTTWSSTDLQHSGSMTTSFTGYWPTVFMNYRQTGMLDSIELKAFSPICAGDNKNSSLPLCIYKFTIRNTSSSTDTASVALRNSANSTIIRNPSGNRVIGIASGTICILVDTLKVDARDSITCSSSNSGFTTAGLLNNSGAGYLAKRVVVPAGGTRTVAFSVAWTGVSNGYYRNYFTNVQTLAAHGRDSAVSLEAKVDNWHNKILNSLNSNLPAWHKDLVINSCHTYNSMTDWTNSGTYGTYGMVESSSSGNYGCIDQSFHASMALPVFAPNAAWSEVQRIAASQHTSSQTGLISHFYPGINEVRSDGGAKLILQAYRDYLWTGNLTALNSMWSNYVSAVNGIRNLDTRDGDGLPDDSLINTYDNPFWEGWFGPEKEYDCELYLGALKAMQKIAVARGTPADTATYKGYFTTASNSFERTHSSTYASSGFWDSSATSPRGNRRGYYTASTRELSNGASTAGGGEDAASWACMFSGQMYADLCGLGALHPEHRIQSGLNFIYNTNFENATPASYIVMAALPNFTTGNLTTYFNSDESGRYVSYVEYPAGDLCAAFQHGNPDIAMAALYSYWYITFSKYKRVYNNPCKVTLQGNGVGWGLGRYMFPPGVFSSLFNLTGFVPDINGRTLRIKPALPTNATWRMDSLVAAPLMNPISLGTVDYRNNTAAPYQRFVIRFDDPMQFDRFFAKKLYGQSVTVRKPAVGGSAVSATIAVNSADTSEYVVTFSSTLTIDSSGVLITIPSTVGTRLGEGAKMTSLEFAVDVKRGTISYRLPRRMKVDIFIVNPLGERMMVVHSEEAAGPHSVRYDWKSRAAGVYYACIRTGEGNSVKRVVHVK